MGLGVCDEDLDRGCDDLVKGVMIWVEGEVGLRVCGEVGWECGDLSRGCGDLGRGVKWVWGVLGVWRGGLEVWRVG